MADSTLQRPKSSVADHESGANSFFIGSIERSVAVYTKLDSRYSIETRRHPKQHNPRCANVCRQRVRKLSQGEWGRRRHWAAPQRDRGPAVKAVGRSAFRGATKALARINHASVP